MSFHWASIVFWTLVLIFPTAFIYGCIKKSWKAMLICFASLLPIAIYFGVGGEIRVALALPFIPLIFAIIYYKELRLNKTLK
jgi:hypothetical protein